MDESTIDFPAGIETGSTPPSGDSPLVDGAAPDAGSGSAGQGPGGLGPGRDSFSQMDTDSGENNTDNGSGNSLSGDNNQVDGTGNWSYGDGNQTTGNGNWYLAGEGSSPLESVFPDGNPLGGGNPLASDGEGIPPEALSNIGGNNPVFAGGGTTPAPVGDGETPATVENPTGNDNVTYGNGNWYFGEGNETNGNGNWYFGSGSSSNGNANWNLGDDNEVSGNGNRSTGSGSTISGNSNRIDGSDVDVVGNRFALGEDGVKVYGNADRYFLTSPDGEVTLMSDESATDSKYDFSGIVKFSDGSEPDELLNGGELPGDVVPTDTVELEESFGGAGTGSLPIDSDSMGGAAGIFLAGEVPSDVPPDVLPVA